MQISIFHERFQADGEKAVNNPVKKSTTLTTAWLNSSQIKATRGTGETFFSLPALEHEKAPFILYTLRDVFHNSIFTFSTNTYIKTKPGSGEESLHFNSKKKEASMSGMMFPQQEGWWSGLRFGAVGFRSEEQRGGNEWRQPVLSAVSL